MSQFKVRDTSNGNERTCDSRSEAEETKNDLVSLGADPTKIEIVPPGEGENTAPDAAEVLAEETGEPKEKFEPEQEIPEFDEQDMKPVEESKGAIDELGESLGTDPLSILPGHMIDTIQGQPAINKRGYAMIAERYGVSVKAEIETYPWENEDGRCVAKAVATTEDGKEYQDYASAAESDGDMSDQLVELASTRALKRVTGWATGLGIVSYQELSSELEDEL